MLKRYLSMLLVITALFMYVCETAIAKEAKLNSAMTHSLRINTTYILKNNGDSDACITVLGSVSMNVRADWIILNSDNTVKSHGNYDHICYLNDVEYLLAPGEKMVLKPICDHFGNDYIQVSLDTSISVSTTSLEPIYRYFLQKGVSYCFSNETENTQYFYFSGDAHQGEYASANVDADFLYQNKNQDILAIGCGNTLTMLENVQISLKPGEKYTVCPRKDQSTSKNYVIAYILNYGISCDITLSDQQPNPVRRIRLLKGCEYSISNLSGSSLPIYFSGQWNGYDASANIKANVSIFENGTLISEASNKLLSTASNSKYDIGKNQVWKIKPISDYYSHKDYVVAFVPYTIDEMELSVSASTKSRFDVPTDQISLRVYQNEKDSKDRFDEYILSDNAAISYNDATYYTEDGIALIPNIQSGTISISKDGFISRTITAKQLQNSKNIHLQKKSTDAPVVSAVWINDIDVLNEDCGVGLLSKEKTTFTAEVDWGGSSYGSISLWQEARSVKFNSNTLTTVLSDNFDVSETIYIVATDAAGNTTKKALKFAPGEVSAIPKVLDGASISFGDKISITLPNNVKPDFFAGQQINVGLTADVPITVSTENGKIYVAVGVDIIKYSKTEKSSVRTNDSNLVILRETQRFTEMFKDSWKDATGNFKKLKNLKQTYKSAISHPVGTFGFEADFTILGFLEGYYDAQGKVTWLDGGIILNPVVSVNKHLPFSLGPVPMYFEASLSGDVTGQGNIRFNETAKKFTPNIELSGTIALSGGVGAGIKKVLYASGGVEGKLMPLWNIYWDKQDYFKLSASANAYAKVGLLVFEYEHNWEPFYNAVWVEYPKSKSIAGMMSRSAFYNVTNYEAKDLSYLNKSSEFVANGNDGVSIMSVGPNAGHLSVSAMKTNIYRESTPQLVTFSDRTALSVWLDSDSSDINGVMLYYSYYDGAKWSMPAPVQADGTMDYTPQLYVINDKAYLVWQNATKSFSDTDGLEDIAAYFDISVATFNATSGFEVSTLNNNGLDMMPVICGNENALYAVWLNNGQNDWFGNNQANSILYAVNNGTGWSKPVTAYSGLNAIDSLSADYNGTLQIAYCMYSDLNAVENVYLYENGTRVTDSAVAEANPQYINHNLYWSSNGNVMSLADSVQETALGAENYQIVSGPDGDVLIYTTADGLASVLNASWYNSETQQWCEPYELMNIGSFIGAFSAVMNGDGTLQVLLNSQEVTGTYTDNDPYGEASLIIVTLSPYCDLSMGDLVYNADQYSAGDAMKISFDLTNTGSQTIRSANITTTDASGTVLNSIVFDDVIVPGQTVSTSTYFNIDSAATGHDISITAIPGNLTDINASDNSRSEIIAFEDISVEQSEFGKKADGSVVVFADVVNYGYHTRSNITVELRENNKDGVVVDSATITSLEPLALDTVSFEIGTQNAALYYVSIRESGDTFTANDTDFAVAALTDSHPFVIVDSVATDEAHLYLSNEKAGTCIVAIYDDNDRMLTVGTMKVNAYAGDIDIPYDAFTSSQFTVKVFFVDEAYAPIYHCVEKEY